MGLEGPLVGAFVGALVGAFVGAEVAGFAKYILVFSYCFGRK